jgi:hypothetical protein
MARRQCLQLTHQLRGPAAAQIRVDPILDRRHTELLESRRLRLRERLVREVRQRCAAPQRQRFAKQPARRRCVLRGERPAPLAGHALEAVQIDPLGIHPQHVARRGGDDGLGAKQLAQAGHIDAAPS